MHKTFTIANLEEIDKVAEEFIQYISESDLQSNIFAFYGKMGAGKTTFIKAICKALGVKDIVNSPTFTIINEYKSAKGLRYRCRGILCRKRSLPYRMARENRRDPSGRLHQRHHHHQSRPLPHRRNLLTATILGGGHSQFYRLASAFSFHTLHSPKKGGRYVM